MRRWTCSKNHDLMSYTREALHTEKTIKKKGLKWSNISVKKYHQRPGFGVRSGKRSLANLVFKMRNHSSTLTTYGAPHDFSIHPQLPHTRVAAKDNNREYTTNSTRKGSVLRRSAVNGRGNANWDVGCDTIRRSRGGRMSRQGRDV